MRTSRGRLMLNNPVSCDMMTRGRFCRNLVLETSDNDPKVGIPNLEGPSLLHGSIHSVGEDFGLEQARLGGRAMDVNKSVPLLNIESGVPIGTIDYPNITRTPSHGASVWGSLAVASSEVHGECR